MISIRRVYSGALAKDADKIPDLLDHPFTYGYRTILLVSQGTDRRVTGFSLFLHFPEISSSLLDFIAIRPKIKGGGLGSALYEATRMVLVSSTIHRVHYVRERGYVERPARIEVLDQVLTDTQLFDRITAKSYGEKVVREVHDPDFVNYLKTVCEKLAPSRPVYPYVFPIRRPERKSNHSRPVAVQGG